MMCIGMFFSYFSRVYNCGISRVIMGEESQWSKKTGRERGLFASQLQWGFEGVRLCESGRESIFTIYTLTLCVSRCLVGTKDINGVIRCLCLTLLSHYLDKDKR